MRSVLFDAGRALLERAFAHQGIVAERLYGPR
jgi:hypothetical protein